MDRVEPYVLNLKESYKVILKYFQGYKVVLSSVLTFVIFHLGEILSLDHGCPRRPSFKDLAIVHFKSGNLKGRKHIEKLVNILNCLV